MIRVVVGEDNYITREGISRALQEEPEIEIVAICPDLPSLHTAVTQTHPDVVLTDIRMPPTKTDEGIRLAAELRQTHPHIGVVILSQYAEPQYATELLKASADRRAYLLKDRIHDHSELGRALREVAAGGSIIDPRIVELLLTAQQQHHNTHINTLTPREKEILALVAEGWSNPAISHQLQITTRAVERHISSTFSKLGLGHSQHTSRRVKATLLYLANQVG